MTGYSLVLRLHSWNRWIVLGLGLLLLVRSLVLWRRQAGDEAWLDRVGLGFLVLLDVQVLLGLALYFVLSPIMNASFADMAATMSDGVARYWTVEHPTGMFVAVVIAHVGGAVRGRREGPARHRVTVIAWSMWLVVTLLTIPWPVMDYGRALLRGLLAT